MKINIGNKIEITVTVQNSFWSAVGVVSCIVLGLAISFTPVEVSKKGNTYQFGPQRVNAGNAYGATAGTIVTGTAVTISSASSSNADGSNTGSYRGVFANDAFHWVVKSTAAGIDFNFTFGDVQLLGANTLLIQTEYDVDPTAPSLSVQICDWVSSASVESAADSECTGGGWRTLNLNDSTSSVNQTTQWMIYDGYFTDNTNPGTAVSTPLSNFVNGSNQVKVRYFSTTNTTTEVSVDHTLIMAVINPVYSASGATAITGTPTGSYASTTIGIGTQTGNDSLRYQVAGDGSTIADFYFSFKNIETHPGMNTILFRAEYSCSAAGISHRPKIYNFTTTSWEDLTTASIACSTTDSTQAWAKNNIDIDDYISNGEIRVGWYGLAAGTQGIRIDFAYIILGATNADVDATEISFGTSSVGTATTSMRDLDMTGTTNTWSINYEDESNAMTHSYYPGDNDGDTTVEEAIAVNIDFDVELPPNSGLTSVMYAVRASSVNAANLRYGLRDYGGLSGAGGGWLDMGALINPLASPAYGDMVTINGFGNAGYMGAHDGAPRYFDSVNGKVNMRFRSSTSNTVSNNGTGQIDFAMVALQWVEDPKNITSSYKFTPTAGELVMGNEVAIESATSTNNEGANVGSWRGLLANDARHWVVQSTASGLDLNLTFDGVQLNGANSMILYIETDVDPIAVAPLIQICDWVSSTNVASAADADCTGGGWRNLNLNDAVIGGGVYQYKIYNGYFHDGLNPGTAVSTPLSNFINGSNQSKIRVVSTVNTTSQFGMDAVYLHVDISPIYSASGATGLQNTAMSGSYASTTMAIGQTPSDGLKLQGVGDGSNPADFYLSFKNIETYEGMNTILVRAEYGCTATNAVTYRPKIYNFTTASWEDLTTASIVCSTSDATNAWAKNNIDIDDYISNGEIRVGWYTLSNTTTGIRIDQMYIVLGSTNISDADGLITFGTPAGGTATSSVRDLDMTGTTNTWDIDTEDESTTFGHDFNAHDTDMDAVVEEAAAAYLEFPIETPTNSAVTSILHAYRATAGTAGTGQMGARDYPGIFTSTGGWSAIGTTFTTTQTYGDNITDTSFTGHESTPQDFYNSVTERVSMRMRTTIGGSTASNSTRQWDFAMMSISWIEPEVADSMTFTVDSNTKSLGTLAPGVPVSASSTLEITTANSSGFVVTAARADADTTMDKDDDAAINIPDKTAWDAGANCGAAGNATASTTEAKTLQFRVQETDTDASNYCSAWWGSDDTTNALFAGFPSSAENIVNRSSASSPATQAIVLYALDVPTSQQTGAYSGDVTYTATANP